MQNLIDKIKAAKEPSRELDAEIARRVVGLPMYWDGTTVEKWVDGKEPGDFDCVLFGTLERIFGVYSALEFTDRIDDALLLMEPDMYASISMFGCGTTDVYVAAKGSPHASVYSSKRTPALLLCEAILTAKANRRREVTAGDLGLEAAE